MTLPVKITRGGSTDRFSFPPSVYLESLMLNDILWHTSGLCPVYPPPPPPPHDVIPNQLMVGFEEHHKLKFMLTFFVYSVDSVWVSRVEQKKLKPQWNMALTFVTVLQAASEQILRPSRMWTYFEKEMCCLVLIWQLKALQPLEQFKGRLMDEGS